MILLIFVGIQHILWFKFLKFRIVEILNFHPCIHADRSNVAWFFVNRKVIKHFQVNIKLPWQWTLHEIGIRERIHKESHFNISLQGSKKFLDLLVLWGKWSKFSLGLTPAELVLKSDS